MASLMFPMASSRVSPWLWQPGRAGQWMSNPYSLSLTTTVYFILKFIIIYPLVSKKKCFNAVLFFSERSEHYDTTINTGNLLLIVTGNTESSEYRNSPFAFVTHDLHFPEAG